MIIDSLQPLLKLHGFKKKGLKWNRERGDFVDVITFQEAKHSTAESPVFTINMGVFVASFFEAIWNKQLMTFASEADCIIRLRLGDLMQNRLYGNAFDQWWTLSGDLDNVESIKKEIHLAISEKAIPFLDSFRDYSFIINHLQKMSGWQTKTPLLVIYYALAEWKVGLPLYALERLNLVKEKSWAFKISKIRELILSSI